MSTKGTKSTFLEKRESLVEFVREQIVGPGAFNKRFFLLEKWKENEFSGKVLQECLAINNISEIISEVPAYHYSSAILFPISKSIVIKGKDISPLENKIVNDDKEDLPENINDNKLDDEDFQDDQTESVSSRNQNYPNTCGISFAVNEKTLLNKDLKVCISFRTYQRVKQQRCKEQKLGYWIRENPEIISDLFKKYYSNIFATEILDGNVFVFLVKGIDMKEHLYTLDYKNLESLLKTEILPKITDKFPDIELFKPTKKTYNSVEFDFTNLYEDRLNSEIENKIRKDKNEFENYSELIKWLEIYNQIKEIVTELKTIYRESSKKNKPTPIWESSFFTKEIELIDFATEKKIKRGEIKIDGAKNIFLSYQYLKHKDKSSGRLCIYVKLILVNKNVIELKDDEPPQLNKKDAANEVSFFGVQIKVIENSTNIVLPYNPPNLLEIDEEDNFNKLIYRQYKDYGEGYNTSVTWGEESGLKFIATEFIPEQETPKVDFKPSKNIDGAIVSRINDSILSIRALSTLTDDNDKNILEGLRQFIEEYKIWIEEKKLELKSNEDILSGKDLLEKQLKACDADYKRLSRNIDLLEKDKCALAAFRLMNTAMFMQLHHSIMVKDVVKNKSEPFIPVENNESYYKKLLLKDDYKWRSFQLAFVLLNIDAFVKPQDNDNTVIDLFATGWPERNELADLVWFPTGGGKTEAYLGIIAFAIGYRRFTNKLRGNGTTVLMRYTLRLLTLQQFQRATLLICALESIRKDSYSIPYNYNLGAERITIGLFVGGDSLPNKWEGENGMKKELTNIATQIKNDKNKIKTKFPHTECPWCGGNLFINKNLSNIHPNLANEGKYNIGDKFKIMCNSRGCTFNGAIPNENKCLPLRLFDEEIYKYPPTLLFGTVDKFASLANKVSSISSERNQDSRRLFGKEGDQTKFLPPELIIQDELHLLLGPLGSAVGLFEKAVDELCTYTNEKGIRIKPKIITSTATTRNTDKQIFALFNRRSEIFPKQGINCDDSFFAYYQRKEDNIKEYASNRKYIGLLPIGKTQVWMQLRIASLSLAHRLKFIKEKFTKGEVFSKSDIYKEYSKTLDYYYTILSYFNSLKEVGKTESQLSHYLPGDLNLIIKNTMQWDFLDRMMRKPNEIIYSELTGRLSGEQVKTNLSSIEKSWDILSNENPPEFVIATNMISVGIDVSRFNTMLISSMPRNTAEYIQASSRVARDKEGVVFTIHHPFRSRDISHYQRFKEFHEKFYGYVEPISVTPFATKALERYFAMYLSVIIRHNETLDLINNNSARNINEPKVEKIKEIVLQQIKKVQENAKRLNEYLKTRENGVHLNIEGIIDNDEFNEIEKKLEELLNERWLERNRNQDPVIDLKYRDENSQNSLFDPRSGLSLNNNWNVKESLREIAPSIVIKTVQQ